MTGNEIRDKILKLESRMEEVTDYTTFTLNPEIGKLKKQIKNLQKQCPHEYNNGFCIYCKSKEAK